MSIIIPAYNEAEIISSSIIKICKTIDAITADYEVIIIDDGSSDATWENILSISMNNSRIKAIRFSRNFGKEKAISAGLEHANGHGVILMDADLQHPPAVILEMYKLWSKGDVDIVRAMKSSRGRESILYKMSSNFFYKLLQLLSGIDLKNTSDFVFLDQKVVKILRSFSEENPFFRGLLAWVGFRQATVFFEVGERAGGHSKWQGMDLIGYAISNIINFSSLPLRLVNYLAALFFALSTVLGAYSIYRYYTHHAVEGFTTVIILLLFIGSSIMLGLGIVGEYISKIHIETKRRPGYVTMDKIGF